MQPEEVRFEDGKLREGRVTFSLDDDEPAVYDGEWHDGRRCGHGVCRAMGDSGRIYEGQWKADRRHGQGVLKTEDGKVIYRGMWVNGQPASWNYYRVRRLAGMFMARVAMPTCGAAIVVCVLALAIAVFLAAPAT